MLLNRTSFERKDIEKTKYKKPDRIWSISLMIISVLSLIIGIIGIAGFEIPHIYRMIIAVIQIVIGTVLLVTTILKCRKHEK